MKRLSHPFKQYNSHQIHTTTTTFNCNGIAKEQFQSKLNKIILFHFFSLHRYYHENFNSWNNVCTCLTGNYSIYFSSKSDKALEEMETKMWIKNSSLTERAEKNDETDGNIQNNKSAQR